MSSEPKRRKLILLGCGGFIGSHLLDRLLLDDRVRVVGWDTETAKIAGHLDDPKLTFIEGDLHDEAELARFAEEVRDADAVLNLAAICNPAQYNTEPLRVIGSNFIEAYRFVEICARAKTWLIHFSTSEVYGRTISSYLPDNDTGDPALFELDEDTTPLVMGPIANQRWSYACAKQLLERFIYAHHWENGLPFTIVRPLNFFGPRMDFIPGRDGEGIPRVLACFITALLDGTPMQLVDGGRAKRTIVSIHDAVRAILLMLDRPERARNQIFNIGNRDNEVTIAELAERMRGLYAEVTGEPAHRAHPIESVSAKAFYGAGYEDCDRRMPKLDKAKTLLGWTPVVPLDEILRETMRHYFELYGKVDTFSV